MQHDQQEHCAFRGAFLICEVDNMENNNRVATVAMIIDDSNCIEQVNELLHDYSRYIIGRMGIPYREKGLNIINVVLDAPSDAISALSGKLGRLQGVTAKAVYAKQA